MGADEYLVNPGNYEGQTITLNVVCVRPVHFQSPIPDIMFYHAMTLSSDRKMGGEILVAVPNDSSSQFAKYYGLDPRGRSSLVMNGTLLLGHRPGPRHMRGPHGQQGGAPGTPETTGTTELSGTDSTPVTTGTGNKPHRHPRLEPGGIWFVDYKGLSADLFSKHPDLQIPDSPGGGEDAPRPEGPRHHPPRP